MRKKKWTVISIVVLFLAVFCIFQNNYITVSDYIYQSPKISGDISGYRIVQVSDLHNKMFGANQRYLMKKIKECAPDMIVVTGDVVDSNHTDLEKAMVFLEEAVKIAPVYYVTGNHELWLEASVRDELIQRMEEVGVVCLDDEWMEVSDFVIIGLDDGSLFDETLTTLKSSVDTEEFTLLLAHEPQYLDTYAKSEVDLVLSGHAHGGQVRLPFVGGLVAPDQGLFPEYTEGMHVQGNTTMIISRGLGNSIIPIRIFNYPELVCVELQHK